jgi:hypothetical protein
VGLSIKIGDNNMLKEIWTCGGLFLEKDLNEGVGGGGWITKL